MRDFEQLKSDIKQIIKIAKGMLFDKYKNM